ncbi:MAG: hypothetical protein V3S55_15550 [Nitrospiraceae bacterium]
MDTIEKLMERTETGYSFDNYDKGSWKACLKMLRRRGFSDDEIVAIMLSKHTRWAHDMSDKDYGKTNSGDLSRYVAKYPAEFTGETLAQLVAGTI